MRPCAEAGWRTRSRTKTDHIDPHAWQSSPTARSTSPISATRCRRRSGRQATPIRPMPQKYPRWHRRHGDDGERGDRQAPAERRKIITIARRLRLFRRGLRHGVHRAGGRRAPKARRRPRTWPRSSARSGGEGPGGVPGEHHRQPAARPDRQGDRRQDRRHALFRRAVAADGPAATYLDMFRNNIETMSEALSS